MAQRSAVPALLALALCASATPSARAGVYNPGESDEAATYPQFMGTPGREFRQTVITLRVIPVDRRELLAVDSPVRRRYLFMEEMARRYPASALKTLPAKLQASAVFIRRGKFDDAQQLLRPLSIQHRDNFVVQSNFATALHQGGDLQKAWDTLNDAMKKWPQRWDELPDGQRDFLTEIGWQQASYESYRVADAYYLRLLKLRLREKLAKKDPKDLSYDAIFDDGQSPPTPVRFVNEQGEFEPRRKAKLPPGALGIVQQLVVWLPEDLRLYWLLGEVYNAEGTEDGVRAAHQIFRELLAAKAIPDEARQKLQPAFNSLDQAVKGYELERERSLMKHLDKIEGTEGINVDWRTLGIGFGAGFVVALFAVWQVREIRRRRARVTSKD